MAEGAVALTVFASHLPFAIESGAASSYLPHTNRFISPAADIALTAATSPSPRSSLCCILHLTLRHGREHRRRFSAPPPTSSTAGQQCCDSPSLRSKPRLSAGLRGRKMQLSPPIPTCGVYTAATLRTSCWSVRIRSGIRVSRSGRQTATHAPLRKARASDAAACACWRGVTFATV
jgi:hypothetical protein